MTRLQPYAADASLKGKLRRRLVRLAERRPARFTLERPMLSVTFDDVPASATENGARVLERAGARGTFFVSAGLCGQDSPSGRLADEAALRAAAAAGHELACHTWSHLDCGQASSAAIEADVALNAATLTEWAGGEPSCFAYPYGDVSAQAKRVLRQRFRALRALHEGVVEDGTDLNQLPSVGVEGRDGEARAAAWIDRAAPRKAWLVLYTHDVRDTPSAWGCTPGALQRLLERAQARGFEVRTLQEGLDRIGAAA